MCNINERLEKLKKETSDLRKEVKDLKETLSQQNELILCLLSKQSEMLDETIEAEGTPPQVFYGPQVSEFSRRFPLENMEDIKKFETEINEDNKAHIVTIIQNLLSPQGLLKNVVNVLSDKIIMKSNVDGHFNKRRLLDFPKTVDILFLASRKDDNYSTKMFLDELRRALRMVKNRCHKNNCRNRQKLQLREEQDQAEQEENAEPRFIVKTEEIYFD